MPASCSSGRSEKLAGERRKQKLAGLEPAILSVSLLSFDSFRAQHSTAPHRGTDHQSMHTHGSLCASSSEQRRRQGRCSAAHARMSSYRVEPDLLCSPLLLRLQCVWERDARAN